MSFSATCNLPAGRLSNRDVDDVSALRSREAKTYGGRCEALPFTDPEIFEAHMRNVHGRTPYSPKVLKPYAHAAPKAPSEAKSAERLDALALRLALGDYDVRMHWASEQTLPAGEVAA